MISTTKSFRLDIEQIYSFSRRMSLDRAHKHKVKTIHEEYRAAVEAARAKAQNGIAMVNWKHAMALFLFGGIVNQSKTDARTEGKEEEPCRPALPLGDDVA